MNKSNYSKYNRDKGYDFWTLHVHIIVLSLNKICCIQVWSQLDTNFHSGSILYNIATLLLSVLGVPQCNRLFFSQKNLLFLVFPCPVHCVYKNKASVFVTRLVCYVAILRFISILWWHRMRHMLKFLCFCGLIIELWLMDRTGSPHACQCTALLTSLWNFMSKTKIHVL